MANYDSNPSNVKLVQHAINVAGYSPQLAEDGKYGPATKGGVVWFQHQHGLSADGIIGDATMAAAGPTPPGADPLAGLRASIAALKATQDAAASAPSSPAAPDYLAGVNFAAALAAAHPAAAPAAPTKVIQLSLRTPSTPTDATMAALAPASLATGTALAAAAAPSNPLVRVAIHVVVHPVPVGIGAAAGAALGAALSMSTAVAVPLLALVGGGAVLGAALGFGFSKMQGSTMHGEADFGIDFGLEDPDELSVVAGEIGMESKIYTLRG